MPSARESSPLLGLAARRPRGGARGAVVDVERLEQRRRLRILAGYPPGVREPHAPGEVSQPARVGRIARPDDLEADALATLEQLAPLDERRQQQVRERAVLEQHPPEHFAVDRYVAHRRCDDRGEEHGLPGEQVHLAEEARAAMADDLLAGSVGDRDLTLDDRDERIARVADLEQRLADLRGSLLAVLREQREL